MVGQIAKEIKSGLFSSRHDKNKPEKWCGWREVTATAYDLQQ
jgi:hypothetical protein